MSSIDQHRPSVSSAFSATLSTSSDGDRSVGFRRLTSSLSIRSRDSMHRQRNASISTVSPEEFDALPSSFQKKYFSPVERLHIGQQAAANKRKKQQRHDQSSDARSAVTFTNTCDESPRPRTAQDRRYLRRRSTSCINATPSTETMISTREEALWYQNLPDKIRRQQFSRVEQHFLGERARAILSVYSEAGESDATTDDVDVPLRRQSEPANQIEEDPTSPDTAQEPAHRSIGMLTTLPSSQSATRSDEPDNRSGSATPPPILLSRKKSAARTLVPIPLPPPRLAPLPIRPLEVAALERSPSIPTTNFSWRRNVPEASPTSPEGPHHVYHYQDPETRNTLRNYLSSNRRFDEVIEFGFPVTSPTASVSSDDDHHTSSVYSDDGTCLSFESHGPLTPTTMPPHYRPQSPQQSSMDYGIALSLPISKSDGYSEVDSFGAGHREMTLRMTLTRPEVPGLSLRVSECEHTAEVYADPAELDPLALEKLTFSDDTTGAHGAFAVQRSPSHGDKLKTVFRSLRGRN